MRAASAAWESSRSCATRRERCARCSRRDETPLGPPGSSLALLSSSGLPLPSLPMSPVIALVLSLIAPWQAAQNAPPRAKTVERVVVIGASMAAGFGAARNLAETIEASIRAPHEQVLGLGDPLFFTSP